jgi:hypothetical protein
MVSELTIWIIVCVAGIACGVIAGAQQRVTAIGVIAIALVALAATTIVAWLFPRHAGHAE